MKRRVVAGEFKATSLGDRLWTVSAPDGTEILLRGADAKGCAWLRQPGIRNVELEWNADRVRVLLDAPDGEREFAADTAIIHEPRARVYEGLPLATFDPDARRFWKRVFATMRLPGGRFLLRILARGGRSRRRPG